MKQLIRLSRAGDNYAVQYALSKFRYDGHHCSAMALFYALSHNHAKSVLCGDNNAVHCD